MLVLIWLVVVMVAVACLSCIPLQLMLVLNCNLHWWCISFLLTTGASTLHLHTTCVVWWWLYVVVVYAVVIVYMWQLVIVGM